MRTAEFRIRIWIAKLLLAAAEKLAYLSRKVARLQAGTRSSIHGRLDKRSNPRSVGGAAQGKIAGRELAVARHRILKRRGRSRSWPSG